MAEESGVTGEGLKATLIEKLQATHVEIEDMSGSSLRPPNSLATSFSPFYPFLFYSCYSQVLCKLIPARRMWSSLQRFDCIAAIRKKDHSGTASASQQHSEGRDCSYSCVDP
jgi:hypothetical protein